MPSARAIVSAAVSTTARTQLFVTSLSLLPAPASPAQSVLFPTASKIGATGSRASSGPEASTSSSPCSAGCLLPRTGASRNTMPRCSARSAHRSVPAIPIVLIWIHVTPSGAPANAPSSPSIDAITASASASIVTIACAPLAASAGVDARVAPTSVRGSAFSADRFQARTPTPARAMFRAIGRPIVPPAPSTATCSTRGISSSSC